MPAEEAVATAVGSRARAVGLSFVFPGSNAQSSAELKRMRTLLPSDIAVLIGGRMAPNYHDPDTAGIEPVDTLDEAPPGAMITSAKSQRSRSTHDGLEA